MLNRTSNHPGKPRILIVDDQPDALRLLQLRLQSAGMQCFPASNGRDALQLLDTQPIDVVILDIMMPEMDGFEVCRRIKSNEKTKDIPVLFLTAKMEVADRVRGLEIGGHDFLGKPVEQQELLARTRAAFRVKQLQDELKHLNQMQESMLAEHWDKCLGQLARSLAHEINNPLTAALGNTDLLLINDNNPHEEKRLSDTRKSLITASAKLKSLLAIAHPHEKQVFDIATVVNDVNTLINYKSLSHQIKVIVSTSAGGKWHGSPTYAARAVFYIVSYLLEHCVLSGGKTVTIEESYRGDKFYLSLFSDAAAGNEETKSLLLNPFSSHAHGINLYLANKIILGENGRLFLKESAGAPGITFEFYLPSSH